MTFQQLEYIVEISKCGSINKAAEAVPVPVGDFHGGAGA